MVRIRPNKETIQNERTGISCWAEHAKHVRIAPLCFCQMSLLFYSMKVSVTSALMLLSMGIAIPCFECQNIPSLHDTSLFAAAGKGRQIGRGHSIMSAREQFQLHLNRSHKSSTQHPGKSANNINSSIYFQRVVGPIMTNSLS